MYSPKIREDLIPRVYETAKQARVPMTVWINRLIESALVKEEDTASKEADDGSGGMDNGNPKKGEMQP